MYIGDDGLGYGTLSQVTNADEQHECGLKCQLELPAWGSDPTDPPPLLAMRDHGYRGSNAFRYVEALNWAATNDWAYTFVCLHVFGNSDATCKAEDPFTHAKWTIKDGLKALAATGLILLIEVGITLGIVACLDGGLPACVADLGNGLSAAASGGSVGLSVAGAGLLTAFELGGDGEGSAVADSLLGNGCLNSFERDTRVLMADGTAKAISQVKVGDKVLAADPATGKVSPRRVTALHVNRDVDMDDVTVVVDRSGDRGTTLHTTQHHLFFDLTLNTWVEAAALRPGDHLETPAGQSATVSGTRAFALARPMYNLTIEIEHTYYVLAEETPVLVHNCFSAAAAGAGLPEYSGGVTTGIGVGSNGSVYDLVSGNKAADADLMKIVNDSLRAAGRLAGTSNSARASDVEQKFAATMVRDGIDNADLVINNPVGPCTVRLGCNDVLNTILGGRTLTVYWPNGNGGWESHTYGGIG